MMSTGESPPFAALHARSHPLRAHLTAEMHLRKPPAFSAPAQLLQVVMLAGTSSTTERAAHLARLLPGADPNSRFLAATVGDLGFAWERHNEFSTFTFIAEGAGATLFDATRFARAANWIDALPGEVIRATHIGLIAPSGPDPAPELLARHFAADDLICCDIAQGQARIWTDFRLHGDGFGRLLVADRGLGDEEAARLVQRLQELGNYRKMALLGLPLARERTPRLAALETDLAYLTAGIADRSSDAVQMQERLSALSVELAHIRAESEYRMSATRAYAQICGDRIAGLAVDPVVGSPSLADFTERRLLPAVRTCSAFAERLDKLAERTAWTSALLRTRVDIELAQQSRDLLRSMDRRSQVQLRLQQTVEGLSVVAIAYYSLAILAYPVKALDGFAGHSTATVMAALAPLVLLATWFTLRTIRRQFSSARKATFEGPAMRSEPIARLKGLEREVVNLKRDNQALREQIRKFGGTPPNS